MVTLTTLQIILICIATFFYGFAVGYVLKATVMKDNYTEEERRELEEKKEHRGQLRPQTRYITNTKLIWNTE